MGRLRHALTTAAALAALTAAAESAQAADGLYGLTSDQTLLRISSADPADSPRIPITGLPDGVRLSAIDRHPTTGVLLGVAGGGDRLFEIDTTSGAASELPHWGSYFADGGTVGMSVAGFEGGTFPVLQLAREDGGIETLLPPDNYSFGFSTAYVPGDAGAGLSPAISGLADASTAGGWRSLGIDHRRNVTARFTKTGTPNAGRGLTTVGALGVDVPEALGFAPAASGVLYLAYRLPIRSLTTAPDSVLRRVDPVTGASTYVGTIRGRTTPFLAASSVDVVGLASAGPVRG